MSFWSRLLGGAMPVSSASRPQAMVSDGGVVINTSSDLEDALRNGSLTASGQAVTPDTALRVAMVYSCVRLISGAVATLPMRVRRRIDAKTREDASDLNIWNVLRRKPNKWQKPAVFKRMMQAHVLLRGNAYAAIVWSAMGDVLELIPLHPDRVRLNQRDDMTVEYIWTRKDGRQIVFQQQDILHLLGLTLDGVTGVTPLTYARETIGGAMSMERHGSNLFRNGAQVSGVLETATKLSAEGRENIKASMEAYRADGEAAGKTLVLEEGLGYKAIALTQEDAQFIESKKLSRSEIAMFFGVPPSMAGDNSGNDTQWGTGLEQKASGFRAYCLEDHLTMWEEGVNLDCITDPKVYMRFNRAAMVQSDSKSRNEAYVKMLQWGVLSPNEVRALEDLDPRDGGDIYYDPPNTAGNPNAEKEEKVDA